MREKGFTLVELLVVIAVIAVLAAIVVAAINPLRQLERARDARRKSDLAQIAGALERRLAAYEAYPDPAIAAVQANGCPDNNDAGWSSHSCWQYLMPDEVKIMPVDPINNDEGNCDTAADCHIYEYCRAGNDEFVLAVNLENDSDPDKKADAHQNCPNGGPNHYWITSGNTITD